MMEKQNIKVFQERDFGELISVSITFFIQEFKPVIKNLLYFVGPFVAVTAILSAVFNVGAANDMTQIINMFKGNFSQMQQSNPNIGGAFFIGLVSLFQNIMLYTVLGVYVKLYAVRGRNGFDTQDVWDGTTSIFWSVLGGQILAGLMIGVGILLLIIPGVYLAIVMSILFIIIIFEEIGVGDSISRSFKLMKGNWWLTFGALIVLGIITSIVSAIFAGVIGLVFVAGVNTVISAIYSIVIGFGSIIISSVLVFLLIFLYTSFVTEKENPTLLDRINDISNTDKETGVTEDIETENNSDKEEKTEEKDTWEKLIDDNQQNKIKKSGEESSNNDDVSKNISDEENRFANNDDENDRFKPKY